MSPKQVSLLTQVLKAWSRGDFRVAFHMPEKRSLVNTCKGDFRFHLNTKYTKPGAPQKGMGTDKINWHQCHNRFSLLIWFLWFLLWENFSYIRFEWQQCQTHVIPDIQRCAAGESFCRLLVVPPTEHCAECFCLKLRHSFEHLCLLPAVFTFWLLCSRFCRLSSMRVGRPGFSGQAEQCGKNW